MEAKKINPIKKFFLICSGANLEILSLPGCGIEHNKYLGIGATIFSTAVLASISGGYALYTVFRSIPLAIGFGLIWGAIIFNLDRYIVSTVKKKAVPENLSFRERLNWQLSESARFAPRLILAVFISIIITRPIELKLFESEIEAEIEKQTSANVAQMKESISGEFPDITRLTAENEKLQREVANKQEQVNSLYELAIAEGMGEQRGNTTGRVGRGPFFEERWSKYEQAKAELEELKKRNEAQIANNERALADVRRQQSERENATEPVILRNGLLARIRTLNDLAAKNRAVDVASWFLVFLFIMLETAPIIVKILSDRGSYDEIYDTLEHQTAAAEHKKKFEIDSRLDAEMAVSERLQAEILAAQLHLSRRTMDALETLASAEIMEAQTEIAKLTVEQWKKAQLDKMRYRVEYPGSARNGHPPQQEQSAAARFGPAQGIRPTDQLP